MVDGRDAQLRTGRRIGCRRRLGAGHRVRVGFIPRNLHDGDLYQRQLLDRWRDALFVCPNAAFVFNSYRLLTPDGSTRAISRERLPSCFPGRVLLEEIYFPRWRLDSPVWGP
jgi:hypothetical protein